MAVGAALGGTEAECGGVVKAAPAAALPMAVALLAAASAASASWTAVCTLEAAVVASPAAAAAISNGIDIYGATIGSARGSNGRADDGKR